MTIKSLVTGMVAIMLSAIVTVSSYADKEPISVDGDELALLAHVINGEAGADWCSDDMMRYVGSVVLNRMGSNLFPDTMYDVVYQKGQYACVWDGNFDKTPCDRAWFIAEDLLKYGSVLPSNVVFQANFKQGDGIYVKEQNMYFCYTNKEVS